MDKSWMKLAENSKGRLSSDYIDGVFAFVEFAKSVVDQEGNMKCPCRKCMNVYRYNGNVVAGHLMAYGIIKTYTNWYYHGETLAPSLIEEIQGTNESLNEGRDDFVGIDALLQDQIRAENIEHNDGCEPSDTSHRESYKKFDKLLKDAQREVYPGCTKYNLLEFVISVMNMKVVNKWSNKSLDMLLEFMKKLLPDNNIVPNSTYEVKKILRELGLGYECIHACKNDCTLFWKETVNLDKCPVCNESRYMYTHGNSNKIPHKVLRWLPLIPRLQKMFMSKKIAQQMKWHNDRKTNNDGVLRHPCDGLEWRDFDRLHPDFAMEPRNVRLGLASDGFNPFGHMSTAYSMWPVIVIPYNLPPWMGMKESFFMMPLLIPGSKAPGRDIDVYLRPLVEELKILWNYGVPTYDAATGDTFQMRAAVMYSIHDFPAYGDISGWTTKGYYACANCNDSPQSVDLNGKIGFIGHRRYLPRDHPWRKNYKFFNGKWERELGSLELPEHKILDQLGLMPLVTLGKLSGKKRTRDPITFNWAKVSIFYELPYWGKKKLRHNIDVMHVEKNLCESLCGTLLGLDKKNKDTYKARMDLEEMGIRKELHLKKQNDGSFQKPHSIFLLTPTEREGFYNFLRSVKYPDGYAGNISKSLNSKNCQLVGLKSHDYHVLLQRILPIGMRGYVNKEINATLFELGDFFENLCAKSLLIRDLKKMEEAIVFILCKLEKIFPPAFFDVMAHLPVHLPREAMLGGPVHYRWMYPIERALGTLKQYVSNRARPEGSIVEAYIMKECISFCSLYFDDGVETVFDRPERNVDRGEAPSGLVVFRETARPTGQITRDNCTMTTKMRDLAQWWLLSNTPEVDTFREEFKSSINNFSESNFNQIEQREFPKWFKQRINALHHDHSPRVNDQLWYLANGSQAAQRFSGCVVNGVRFRTREVDDRRTTQNSGVHVIAPHGNEENHEFYGHLCNVWELEYMCNKTVVLFECVWYNTGNATGRKITIQKDLYCTSIDVKSRWYKNDPFVLPSQVKQVFYVNDTKLGEPWRVVVHCEARGNFDFPDMGDDARSSNDVFQQFISSVPIPVSVEEFDVLGQRDVHASEVIEGNLIMQAMNENNNGVDPVSSDDDGNSFDGDENNNANEDIDADLDYE